MDPISNLAERPPWLARVYDSSGLVVGTAFLADDQHLLTCAHVVNAAMGRHERASEPPSPLATVSIYLLGSPSGSPEAAHVVSSGWVPIGAKDDGDIAVLRLRNPSASLMPAPLRVPQSGWDHRFQVCGFPRGFEGGRWATGVTLGRVGEGWGWVQLRDPYNEITRGFSGSPVWDLEEEGVVGMVVAQDRRPGARTAFLIPTEALVKVWPGLRDRLPKSPGSHRWVWPPEGSKARASRIPQPSAGKASWPTPPAPPSPAEARAALAESVSGHWFPTSAFDPLFMMDATVVELRVAAAFDQRKEAWVQRHPGPPQGRPEEYEGPLLHAWLSVDGDEYAWQRLPSWRGVRQGSLRRQACLSCAGQGRISCQECRGTHRIIRQPEVQCSACNGSGTWIDQDATTFASCKNCDGSGMQLPVVQVCTRCSVNGFAPCPECDGNGFFTDFLLGELRREIAQFRIRLPENDELEPVSEQSQFIRAEMGWPDFSDLPDDIRFYLYDQLQACLVQNQYLLVKQSANVYHLRTELYVLPAVGVVYEGGRGYLVGPNRIPYLLDETPKIRLRRVLTYWRERFQHSTPWLLIKGVLALIGAWCGIAFG
jgi:hypothetical protein